MRFDGPLLLFFLSMSRMNVLRKVDEKIISATRRFGLMAPNIA
jgi:hypothetical protein